MSIIKNKTGWWRIAKISHLAFSGPATPTFKEPCCRQWRLRLPLFLMNAFHRNLSHSQGEENRFRFWRFSTKYLFTTFPLYCRKEDVACRFTSSLGGVLSLWLRWLKPDGEGRGCAYVLCSTKFGLWKRRHHCRKCGDIFCDAHCRFSLRLLRNTTEFTDDASFPLVRGCPTCLTEYDEWLITARVESDYSDRQGLVSDNEYRFGMDHVKNKFNRLAISTPADETWSTF